MISSSNRSVMVSKSAKVSIWKERDETGTEGAVATRPGSAHKPVFLHQASGHILGLCPCLTFGLQIRIQHQEKKPSTGAFQIGLTMGSLFLGETTGSTLQRKVVKIKRANRCKASKTLEIILFPLPHMSVSSPCRVHGLVQSRCQRKGERTDH